MDQDYAFAEIEILWLIRHWVSSPAEEAACFQYENKNKNSLAPQLMIRRYGSECSISGMNVLLPTAHT